MQNSGAQVVDQFLSDIRRSAEIYGSLIELTHEQGRVLSSGDTDELIRIAREKQAQLSRLGPLDASIRTTRKEWEDDPSRLPASRREEVNEAVSHLETVLKDLLTLERDQERVLLSEKEKALEEIRRVDAGRRVQRAYAAGPASSRSVLDRKE